VAEVRDPLVHDQVAEAVAGVPGSVVGGKSLAGRRGVGVGLDALGPAGVGEPRGGDPVARVGPLGRRVAEVVLVDHVLRVQPGGFDQLLIHRQRLRGGHAREIDPQRLAVRRRVEPGVVEPLEVILLHGRRRVAREQHPRFDRLSYRAEDPSSPAAHQTEVHGCLGAGSLGLGTFPDNPGGWQRAAALLELPRSGRYDLSRTNLG
jgi:hypothetical protein